MSLTRSLRCEWYASISRTLGFLIILGFGGGGVTLGLLVGQLWLAVALGGVGFSMGWFLKMTGWNQRPYQTCLYEYILIPLLGTLLIGFAGAAQNAITKSTWIILGGWTIYAYIALISYVAAAYGDRIQQKFFHPPHIRNFSHP
jgi:hypothetical protein